MVRKPLSLYSSDTISDMASIGIHDDIDEPDDGVVLRFKEPKGDGILELAMSSKVARRLQEVLNTRFSK